MYNVYNFILKVRKEGNMSDRLLKASEIAYLVGISVETLDIYYRFKKENPDNEYAKMLPTITYLDDNKRLRLWTEDDVYKIAQFKDTIPKGRNGILGSVTRRYTKDSKHYKPKEA